MFSHVHVVHTCKAWLVSDWGSVRERCCLFGNKAELGVGDGVCSVGMGVAQQLGRVDRMCGGECVEGTGCEQDVGERVCEGAWNGTCCVLEQSERDTHVHTYVYIYVQMGVAVVN